MKSAPPGPPGSPRCQPQAPARRVAPRSLLPLSRAMQRSPGDEESETFQAEILLQQKRVNLFHALSVTAIG